MIRQRERAKHLFLFGLVIIVVLVTGLLKPVQETWWSFTRGVQGVFSQAGYYIGWWWHTKELLQERDALLAEKYNWVVDQARLLNLERENSRLLQATHFFSSNNLDYLGVRIITKDKFNERLITLDQGQNNGVEKNQAFVNEQGVILGKVLEVGPDRAKVLLLSDPKSQLAVAVEKSATLGLLQGRLGGGLALNYIPLDLEIKNGEMVYTSGLEPLIPAGLAVGTVINVHKEVGDLFQDAEVQSLVNLQEINQGWIIR